MNFFIASLKIKSRKFVCSSNDWVMVILFTVEKYSSGEPIKRLRWFCFNDFPVNNNSDSPMINYPTEITIIIVEGEWSHEYDHYDMNYK